MAEEMITEARALAKKHRQAQAAKRTTIMRRSESAAWDTALDDLKDDADATRRARASKRVVVKRRQEKSRMKAARDRPRQALKTVKIDNPGFDPMYPASRGNVRRISATVNVLESAVATLAARKLLDDGQVRAADKFRGLWEAAGGSGAKALDYSRENVDGGGAVEPISSRQVIAGRELKRCRDLLGQRGFDLIQKVCGEGLALAELAPQRRGRDTAADNLRGWLDDLAGMWFLATTGNKAQTSTTKGR